MSDDSPNPGRERPNLLGRGPTGLSGGWTLVLSILLLGLLFVASMALPGVDRASTLRTPIASAERFFERRLELCAAAAALPEWEQAALAPFLEAPVRVREEAIGAFEGILAQGGYPREDAPVSDPELDGLRARRVVLLAEAGRMEEAQGDLDALAARGHAAFLDAVRRAYSNLPGSGSTAGDGAALALAGDGWIGRLVQSRSAGAPPPDPGAHTTAALNVSRALALLLACGAAAVLGWLARNRPDGPTGTLPLPAPWPAEVGFGVLVRAAALGLAIVALLTSAGRALGSPVPYAWVSLFAALPLARLVWRHLLAPFRPGPLESFGLTLGGPITPWLLLILGLFALDRIGSQALAIGATSLGSLTPWAEGLNEDLLWSPTWALALSAVDHLIWAPLAAELAFRGILFPTLRRVHGRLHSAVLCGLLYSTVQLTALPAMMALAWSATLYALSVERTRSLLPAIACHALGNAFVMAHACALYR